MKRSQAVLALGVAAAVVLALLSVFAIELSNTQAKSKADVKARVQERAVLAGALITSLFQTVEQQLPQDEKLYGARTVSDQTLQGNRSKNSTGYVALLDARETVLAATKGFTAQARANLPHSAALRLVRAGDRYGLGNVLPYGKTGIINLAVPFPTRFGERILLQGFVPQALAALFNGELHQIPGVKGSHNYILDGNNVVLASTNPAIKVDSVLNSRRQIEALHQHSGDSNGHYYTQVPLADATWRILLASPNGPLFASVSGIRKWVPWIIFIAFALVALVALLLGRRALSSAEDVRQANARLADVNAELATTNVTLEHRAAELARSNAELEQFASIASHDLQEPLRKVRTFTTQLSTMEGDHLSEKGRDYLERANSAAERMQKLIEDLLKFSRVATHGRPFTTVDLDHVCHEVLEDLDHEVERSGAQVRIGELPEISADPLQMRQLFQNLISNAIKFRREGVTPEISIDSTHTRGGNLMITVTDNGIGFDPQYSRRIFRVFERLHSRSAYPGTGIGLALCRKIAERHGGTMIADSTPGEGSKFTVTIPIEHRGNDLGSSASIDDSYAAVREETYVSA